MTFEQVLDVFDHSCAAHEVNEVKDESW
jgi:hypothetical protein